MRYLRMYACFVRFSFSKAMEFRFDFFFRIGMDVLFYIVSILFFEVLYRHTGVFGGWTRAEVLLFQAGFFFVDAVYMTVFSSNMWWLPFLINRGDLDYYLVRPVRSLFFLSLREFAANSFFNLLITAGFLVYVLVAHPEPLGAANVVGFLALLLVGVVLHWALSLTFLVPVFWLHAGMGLREVSFSLSRYESRPDRIYTGWLRRLFTVFLPYAVIISFPTRVLLDEDPWIITGWMLAVTAAWITIAITLWRFGLRAYSSASS